MKLATRLHWIDLAEYGVTLWAMALVVTGHMLPSGAVSAQEPLSVPVIAPADPTPVEAAAPSVSQDKTAAQNLPTPEVAKTLPAIVPAVVANPLPREEAKYTFNDWTVTVRSAPKVAHPVTQWMNPIAAAPQVKVPVHVQVSNNTNGFPLLWNVNSTYNPWWQAPTSAYLFQRPLPYWKLRGDFYHLAPFINW